MTFNKVSQAPYFASVFPLLMLYPVIWRMVGITPFRRYVGCRVPMRQKDVQIFLMSAVNVSKSVQPLPRLTGKGEVTNSAAISGSCP